MNIKKYTKDQMAKMVEEAAERLESLKSENADLIEKLRRETAERIALRNDLMAKMHSNAVLTEKLDQMNGEAITRENVIAKQKADADCLRNNLDATEAALGRANEELTRSTIENKQMWDERVKLVNRAAVECARANYAEAHPWRNLRAWVKRKVARHE